MRRRRRLLIATMLALPISLALAGDDDRFDLKVREEIFAGFRGDEKSMARGLDACEAALKQKPDYAKALVWRGAARTFQGGQAFRRKDREEGLKLWQTGLADMDRAVALEPKDVGVRIPRAVVLLPASRSMQAETKGEMLAKAAGDLEVVYESQKDRFDKIGTHPLGELRMGLAEAYMGLGRKDDAVAQLEAARDGLTGTKYAAEAATWLNPPPGFAFQHQCIGCHSR
ncbi:hypothetical protein [Paludisphaera rhizosphaerae]|uniref:hypothetical protein n=1 Tax=Paludisphaera rhizosphaerae TaxID=2711216 RepID=UPI0013EB8422|nr:hypothetical protein [Paludisphaera rhizosphaerae]